MIGALDLSQAKASLIYGAYTACVFLTPIFGGMIADRWLGRHRAVLIGGATMALGHLVLSFPDLFYMGLACVALGNGMFFPSLPSQLSSLYAADATRQRGSYYVYYLRGKGGGVLRPEKE